MRFLTNNEKVLLLMLISLALVGNICFNLPLD